MSGRLAGKVAVITGGASGIGKATARRFLAEGARVVIADFNETTGKEALDDLEAPDRLRFIRTDVAEESDVEAAVQSAVDEFGGLDVMFNNAGVGGAFGPITDIDVGDWDYTFAVLTRGPFLGIKHAARAMGDHGRGGSIISTASVAGLSGGSGPVAYSAAKAAVVNLTRAASIELAAMRIRVNAICPGGILTALTSRGDDAAAAERMTKLQPWPEHGDPDYIARAALFLASDDAMFVTGEALVVDGGLTANGPGLFQRMMGPETGSVMRSFSGVSRGSTGVEPTIRPLDTK